MIQARLFALVFQVKDESRRIMMVSQGFACLLAIPILYIDNRHLTFVTISQMATTSIILCILGLVFTFLLFRSKDLRIEPWLFKPNDLDTTTTTSQTRSNDSSIKNLAMLDKIQAGIEGSMGFDMTQSGTKNTSTIPKTKKSTDSFLLGTKTPSSVRKVTRASTICNSETKL